LLRLLEKVIFVCWVGMLSLQSLGIDTPITCSHEDIQAKRTHKKGEGLAFDENSLRRYILYHIACLSIFHLSTHCFITSCSMSYLRTNIVFIWSSLTFACLRSFGDSCSHWSYHDLCYCLYDCWVASFEKYASYSLKATLLRSRDLK